MRNYKMDCMKALLIICVVLGHLLELDRSHGINKLLYLLIYSFHMPIFVYVSGYFASLRIKRLALKIVWPYLLFQVLYTIFVNGLNGTAEALQFREPYWLLWYLFAMAVWSLTLPILQRLSHYARCLLMIAAITAAIGAGYIDAVGREFSLSRIIVFYPFFLLGYFGRNPACELSNPAKYSRKLEKWSFFSCIIVLTAVITICCLAYERMPIIWLYEAASYHEVNMPAVWRVVHLMTAGCWLVVLNGVIPDKGWNRIAQIGQNTMPIYLMHGFVIKWMDRYEILLLFRYQTLIVFLIAFLIVMVFSTQWFSVLFSLLFGQIPAGKNKGQKTGKTD